MNLLQLGNLLDDLNLDLVLKNPHQSAVQVLGVLGFRQLQNQGRLQALVVRDGGVPAIDVVLSKDLVTGDDSIGDLVRYCALSENVQVLPRIHVVAHPLAGRNVNDLHLEGALEEVVLVQIQKVVHLSQKPVVEGIHKDAARLLEGLNVDAPVSASGDGREDPSSPPQSDLLHLSDQVTLPSAKASSVVSHQAKEAPGLKEVDAIRLVSFLVNGVLRAARRLLRHGQDLLKDVAPQLREEVL